jgi:hypothetical protein
MRAGAVTRVIADALIAFAIFNVTFSYVNAAIAIYALQSLKEGKQPSFCSIERTPYGGYALSVDVWPAVAAALPLASLGAVFYDRKVARKRKGVAIPPAVLAAAISVIISAIISVPLYHRICDDCQSRCRVESCGMKSCQAWSPKCDCFTPAECQPRQPSSLPNFLVTTHTELYV